MTRGKRRLLLFVNGHSRCWSCKRSWCSNPSNKTNVNQRDVLLGGRSRIRSEWLFSVRCFNDDFWHNRRNWSSQLFGIWMFGRHPQPLTLSSTYFLVGMTFLPRIFQSESTEFFWQLMFIQLSYWRFSGYRLLWGHCNGNRNNWNSSSMQLYV